MMPDAPTSTSSTIRLVGARRGGEVPSHHIAATLASTAGVLCARAGVERATQLFTAGYTAGVVDAPADDPAAQLAQALTAVVQSYSDSLDASGAVTALVAATARVAAPYAHSPDDVQHVADTVASMIEEARKDGG